MNPAERRLQSELLVMETITKLFKGMQQGDSVLVHSVFTSDVTLATVYRNNESEPHQQIWFEETWNYKIEIDGDFAQVWCDCGFYLGNSFSHCGVDAFHLFKDKISWKIFHITDTRRKTDCIIPQSILEKHK